MFNDLAVFKTEDIHDHHTVVAGFADQVTMQDHVIAFRFNTAHTLGAVNCIRMAVTIESSGLTSGGKTVNINTDTVISEC